MSPCTFSILTGAPSTQMVFLISKPFTILLNGYTEFLSDFPLCTGT